MKGGEGVMDYIISLKVDGGELEKIMNELTAAQETIYKCYSRLKALGVVEVKDTASGN